MTYGMSMCVCGLCYKCKEYNAYADTSERANSINDRRDTKHKKKKKGGEKKEKKKKKKKKQQTIPILNVLSDA